MQTAIQTPDSPGLPVSIEDIVTGKRQIICRLAWKDSETGEINHSFWRNLEQEEQLQAEITEYVNELGDMDLNWVEYDYS